MTQFHLPPTAVSLYETLRAQALNGGVRRAGLAAVCYHGMLQGLRLLAADVGASELPAVTWRSAPPGDALVRQLANMILSVQSEPMHVY
jgi:hypothetical protein